MNRTQYAKLQVEMSRGGATYGSVDPRKLYEAARREPSRPYLAPQAIRVVVRERKPVYLPLPPSGSLTFGRDPSCSVVLTDDSISRHHAKLTQREDGLWVFRDLGSTNGSFLSEFIQPEPDDPLRQLGDRLDHVVGAGQAVVLGKAVTLALLAALPDEARTDTQSTSPATRRLDLELLDHAGHEGPVFLLGPTGSGKGYIARRIHVASGRRGRFVQINCSSLPKDATALHSELLGHERGAFTGAVTKKDGKLQAAHEGTLFLDEVESLNPEAQGFLLDLLDQNSSSAPLGADPKASYPPPRFRLISASKVPLSRTELRKDLQFRLASGGSIILPTLAERREDIQAIVSAFLQEFRKARNIHAALADDAYDLLKETPWPGHVRELLGIVETAVNVAAQRTARQGSKEVAHSRPLYVTRDAIAHQIDVHRQSIDGAGDERHPTGEYPVTQVSSLPPPRKRPADLTADDVRSALRSARGNLTHAARRLGIVVNTLKKKLRKFGIEVDP